MVGTFLTPSISLTISICSSLKSIVNLLASGKAPNVVAKCLVGGALTALNKINQDCAPYVRPIAMDEILRRLTGKCFCLLIKAKASDFCDLNQLGVAYPLDWRK